MSCKECPVINRCISDGGKIGTAKYIPCYRNSFYDSKHKFCDRENTSVVANDCYFCRKSICKNTELCSNLRAYREED